MQGNRVKARELKAGAAMVVDKIIDDVDGGACPVAFSHCIHETDHALGLGDAPDHGGARFSANVRARQGGASVPRIDTYIPSGIVVYFLLLQCALLMEGDGFAD